MKIKVLKFLNGNSLNRFKSLDEFQYTGVLYIYDIFLSIDSYKDGCYNTEFMPLTCSSQRNPFYKWKLMGKDFAKTQYKSWEEY